MVNTQIANYATSIVIEPEAVDVVVANNSISGRAGNGIHNRGAVGTAITNNTVSGHCLDGIRVDGGDLPRRHRPGRTRHREFVGNYAVDSANSAAPGYPATVRGDTSRADTPSLPTPVPDRSPTPTAVLTRSSGGRRRSPILALGNGQIALFARANNKFVAAEAAGTAPLEARRLAVGGWERFTMIRNSDGSVSFEAAVNNRYVAAEAAGAEPLLAGRAAIGTWERFIRG